MLGNIAGEKLVSGMNISIVVVNWNVKDYLRRCLTSIYKFTKDLEFEVFVVDNNSSDGSQVMVREDFPQVRLIVSPENLGFARGNNLALESCRGRYIIILNPDTELVDNGFKEMALFMEANPSVSVLAPRLIYPDGSLQRSCRNLPTVLMDFWESLYLNEAFPRSNVFNRYLMGMWEHNCPREVDQPYGACLMIRDEVLKKIGFFDGRFFMYYDEVDLCYRIKMAGGRIYYLPRIEVIHHSNKSSNQDSLKCECYKAKSRLLFFQKHYGNLAVAALFFNLSLRTALVWVVFSFSHFLCGRPRDVEYFKGPVRVIWSQYIDFLCGKPEKK